jgi:predicted nucleotidyltransferase
MEPAKWTVAQITSRELKANTEIRQGRMNGPAWIEHLQEDHPDLYKDLDAKGFIEPLKTYTERITRSQIPFIKQIQEARNGQSGVLGKSTEAGIPGKGAGKGRIKTQARGTAGPERSANYPEAAGKAGNPWIKQDDVESNKGRTLLVQFTSNLMGTGVDSSADYYNKLYSGAREGYSRLDDFWEIPQWIGQVANTIPNTDVYIVRDMEDAKKFVAESGYDHIAFSSLDVTIPLIKELAPSFPGKVSIGGYANKEAFKDVNHQWFDSIAEMADEFGHAYDQGTDYKHFAGSQVIPRLTMSQGCKYKCAFCTVPKQLDIASNEFIDQQLESFKDLDARLIYLNDKTFGQANNYQYLSTLNERMKKMNPKFEGFIIQTTASDLNKMPVEWLQKSGIKYVELGVESYNDFILKSLHKPHNEKIIDKATAKLRDLNINLVPNIIIGIPEETSETYERTLVYLEKNKDIISHANIYNLALYEGTELSDKIETKSESDSDENVGKKSFHQDETPHEQFSDKVFTMMKDRLSEPPVTAPIKTQARNINTETPEFKAWFGESKVVDGGGKPLVVYRGMTNDTQPAGEFGGKNWFAEDPSHASVYAMEDEGYEEGANVSSVYLQITNPLDVGDIEAYDPITRMPKYEKINSPDFIAEAKQQGYDGLVAMEAHASTGKPTRTFLAFSPTQIKSVNNRGTWDAKNPDIRMMARPVQEPEKSYPDIKWVKRQLRTNLYSRVNHDVLDAFIVGSEAKGTAKDDSDIDVAVIIPKVQGKSALQVSERYHSRFMKESQKPTWDGRVIDFQFFYQDDPELVGYQKIPLGTKQTELKTKARSANADSPEFKKWFGDSKVVDENGEPLVVYHGTKNSFNEFDVEKHGVVFFTPDKSSATNYAYERSEGSKGHVFSTFLKMENPEIIDYKGKGDNDIYQDAVDAQADGKDGLIALNTDDGNKIIDQYAVFSPTQIKSATDNVGTFDANNPDIRAMARPVTATSRVSATEAASQFPEVNERLESNRGTKELTIKEKAEEKFKSGWKDVTRHFPALEKSDAAIADVLRRFQDAPHWAKEETGNKIISFVKDLGEHGRKVYGMNIILRDMIKDIKAGRKAGESPEGLQFGYKNLQQVEADLKHFQDIADKHPEIKAALERRNEYMRQITDDLIRLKLLPKDTVNNPAEYFHHQVMIYTIDKQQQMQSVGTGKDVRVHTKGFQKGRNESLQDYNTEYVEAEFDVIANSLVQIRTAEVIKELEGLADVKPEMDLKAKQMNTEKFWQKIQDRKFTGVMQHDDDPLLPFKAKLAVGFQRLYRAITAENSNVYIPDEFQEVVEHLQEMAELRKEAKQEGVEFFPSTHPKMFALLNFLANSKTDAAIPAATIFKAIASRNAFIREVVGKDWKTYKDLMGKDEYADYTEFTPDSSPAFFKINSLTDQAVEQVAQGIKDVKEAIKPILAKGYNTQWVVKKGVKYTLDNFKPQTNESALETISKTALSTWKQWILVNPFRVIKYNFNNISGDMDACIAYDWRIVKDYGWQAMKDLYSASKGQASKELMQELSDKTKMGIIGSGMTQMDIGDLSGNKPVKDMVDFLDGKANGIVSLSRWYGTSKKFSTMRENILRLAAARYFEARLAKGDKIYAASDKEEIDAVRAQLGDAETAAKLARELLGDYGNISHAGQYIRQRLIPFWSWCVPADTEILTKNGWKHKEDLIIGEDVLTYNMEKRITEWQPVQDKAEYPFNGDLVTLKNSYGFKYQFTEDHRVVVIEKYNDQRKIVLAKDLKTHQHIPLVAPHKFTEDSILSVTDAALLGWLVTDGYFRTRDHSPNSFEAMLYQKKPEMVSKIRSMFADYISSESIHPDTGTICFRLKAGEMMNIRKVFSSKEDMPSIVTRLSEDACNAMYQAMLDAEGTVTLGVGGSTAFPQNDGPVLDAFQILCYMLGKAGHIREKNCKGHFGQDGKQHTIYVKKGDKLQINKWQKSLEHYDGVVWCPKTENSTWIMRQNGKVMITGNCEINAPRYVRLFRNLSNEEGKGIAGLSSAMAWKASSLGLKASLLMVLIMIWNAAMFPDEEDELQETGRQQLHAILGRREDGSIMTIRFQGALSDALGWFGMSNPLEQFRAVQSGHKGAADIAKDVSSAGALKIFQGFRPEPKLLYETISGQSFYPNPGRPTPIRDTYEHIARVFSLDKIYNRAAGKPLKGGTWENQLSRDIAGLLINESDPGEQAYYTSRKMVFDWLEKNGKERGSALPTNSSNALYYYKQALKYGDMDAAEKYLKKYQDLGGKFHGIQMSIQRAHPLSSLKLSDRAKFKESLSLEDKQTMDVALEWYKKHFREAYAEQRKAAAKQ